MAGAPKATTNRLQWVLNAAAHVVSGTHKFDRGLSRLFCTELHWLDVPERVVYKLGVDGVQLPARSSASVPRGIVPTSRRQHLRSVTLQFLVVPRHWLSSYGRQAFSVAGPSVWNSPPVSLRDPVIGGSSFRQSLKTFLFATYWCIQRIRGFATMRFINRHFIYLLT